MINLNKIANRALLSALRRGKVEMTEDFNKLHCNLKALYEEVEEVKEASEFKKSSHIEATEIEEELVDVLISCMTELSLRGANVEALIKAKLEFNEKRKD